MWGFSKTMDGNALSAFRLVHRFAQSKKTRRAAGF